MKIVFDDGTIFMLDEKQEMIDESAVIVDFYSRTIQILDDVDDVDADNPIIQYQLNYPNTVNDNNRWKGTKIAWYESPEPR